MSQRLDTNAGSTKRKYPRELDYPWSMLFIPAFVILAGLSIPYALVASPVQKWRERNFRSRMRTRGRLVRWDEFRRAVDEGRGTLIVEQYSFKGPFRWWWTPETVYLQCPVPIIQWIAVLPNDERYRSLAEWCHNRYTNSEAGTASLVEGVPASDVGLFESALAWMPERFGFIRVVPPVRLRKCKVTEG